MFYVEGVALKEILRCYYYVGKTTRQFKDRLSEHRDYPKNISGHNLFCDHHFLQPTFVWTQTLLGLKKMLDQQFHPY